MRTTRFRRPLWVALLVLCAVAPIKADPAREPKNNSNRAGSRFDVGLARATLNNAAAPALEVRRAVRVASRSRRCDLAAPLARVLDSDDRDATTRSLAALSMGELDCRKARNGQIRSKARAALERALRRTRPIRMRRAAARSMGRARVAKAVPKLRAVFRDEDEEPLLRVIAGQSLTRITRRIHYSRELVERARRTLVQPIAAEGTEVA